MSGPVEEEEGGMILSFFFLSAHDHSLSTRRPISVTIVSTLAVRHAHTHNARTQQLDYRAGNMSRNQAVRDLTAGTIMKHRDNGTLRRRKIIISRRIRPHQRISRRTLN